MAKFTEDSLAGVSSSSNTDGTQDSAEDGLVPPPHFQRMLSWRLSQAVDYSESVVATKKAKKKKRRESRDKEQRMLLDISATIDAEAPPYGKRSECSYTVINSDGEEEVYYSALESLGVSSDSEGDGCDDGESVTVPSLSTVCIKSSEVMELEKDLYQTKSSTKRSKKRQRQMRKVACMDFFEPLCNLFEEKISLDVEEMDLGNFSTVPSLCEICLRSIRMMTIGQEDVNLPYLITSLVSNDRRLSSTVSGHVQWIEKLLGEVERFELHVPQTKKRQGGTTKDPPPTEDEPYAYGLQGMFLHDYLPVRRGEVSHGDGYHAHLPNVLFRTRHRNGMVDHDCYLLRPLLHYANYFYPLMVDSKIGRNMKVNESGQTGHTSLTVAQRVGIGRVNFWISTRYPLISKLYSESLKLWPGYVHWARGNLQLAMEAFARALEELNDTIDQAVLLNEMGRMFLYFNERRLAVSHYSKSYNVDTTSCDASRYGNIPIHKPLILPCNLALQASVWDTGTIDCTSAIMARKSWDSVLKECKGTSDYPSNVWYLHVAAVESKVFVHAGQPVEPRTPDQHERLKGSVSSEVVLKWANECEELIRSHNYLSQFPILYYHLSIIHAIKGEREKSRRAFDAYLNDFAGFGEWDSGLPGYQFYQHLTRHQRPHPWKNLFDLVSPNASSGDVPHMVPILPLRWRVRLLHPLHPYASDTLEGSTVADHSPCSRGLNLRLTSDGHLTGDLQMDLPPLKTVLIDPYTGELCFHRTTSLKHYFYNGEYSIQRSNVDSTLPWPMRVYESPDCVVELVMAHKPDKEYNPSASASESNYMCVVHWYGSDGSHHKIDLRRLIRKERRKALLDAMKYRLDVKTPPEEVIKRVDYMFDNGLEMQSAVLYDLKGPTPKRTKGSATRRRDRQFMLYLQSYVVLGAATVRLAFTLQPSTNYWDMNEAIVFLNCESFKDFLSPRVYVVPEEDGFSFLWPLPDLSKPYSQDHMKHIKFSTVVQSKRKKARSLYEHTKLVFDNKGDIIARKHVKDGDRSNQRPSQLVDLLSGIHCLGERCYQLNQNEQCVKSWSITNQKLTHQSCRMPNPLTLLSAPGLLLVVCRDGVVVLHPGTLERLNLECADPPPPQDGMAHPQFNAVEVVVDIIAVHDVQKLEEAVNDAEEEALVQAVLLASLDPEFDEPNVMDADRNESEDRKGKEDNTEQQQKEEEEGGGEDFLIPDNVSDYGSGCTVLSIDDRLLILECSPRTVRVEVKFDIKLPGKLLDFHVMKGFGFIVTVSQFSDIFRSDLYWISPKGTLLGMLPCLGINPHSLFSVFLPPRSKPLPSSGKETRGQDGGMHLFFDDGVGGICCLRLKDVLN